MSYVVYVDEATGFIRQVIRPGTDDDLARQPDLEGYIKVVVPEDEAAKSIVLSQLEFKYDLLSGSFLSLDDAGKASRKAFAFARESELRSRPKA